MCIISLICEKYVGLLQCVAVCCIMLQCGVVCCSVLQVLQCVVVCCSARLSTVPRSHTLVTRDLYQLKKTYRPAHSQDTFVRPWDLTIYIYIKKHTPFKRDLRKRSTQYLMNRFTQYVSTPWISGTTNMSKETYTRDLLHILFIDLLNMSRPHGCQVRQICQKRPTQEIHSISYS